MDSLIAWTIPIDGDGDGASDSLAQGSPQVPYMTMFDITVDATGQLHIIGSMLSSSDTSAAQFGFVWVGVAATELFHFITDGQTWENYRITDWYNEDGPIGGENHDERVQASRSEDGQYVFFTFARTWYEVIEEGNVNAAPDIYGYAYRLSDGYIVEPRNYGLLPGTEFLDFEFTDVATVGYLHMLAPVSIQGGEFWDHELPIVYGLPRDLSSDLQPIDYFFLRSAGFDNAEFHERGGVVSTNEPKILTDQVSIFPNPSSGEIIVDLSALEQEVNITVFDNIGRKLKQFKQQVGVVSLNLSHLNNGVYHLMIYSDKNIIAKKVMIQK